MEINATAVIDSLICEFDEIEQFQQVRDGKHLYIDLLAETDPRRIASKKADAAESRLSLASDILDISAAALYGTVLAARRWYNRTNWQKCLPYNDAEKLLNCMAAQYPTGSRRFH